MTADKPGLVINREAFAEVWEKAWTASTPRPQRGQPHVDGPLGGAFLIPRPLAVVDYSLGQVVRQPIGVLCELSPPAG